MKLTLIAAIGKNHELGKNNDMIWHLPQDLKFFRQETSGHTIVMGRKTFESLPVSCLSVIMLLFQEHVKILVKI